MFVARRRGFAVLMAVCLLACAHPPEAAVSQAHDGGVLPAPTGTLSVATTVVFVVDSQRATAEFPEGRPMYVQAWYPTAATGGSVAPYLLERSLTQILQRDGYYSQDSAAIDHWSRLATHSRLDQAPASGRHPLLLFSVGLGVIRANYTTIAQELASHGYIVAVVESPGQGLFVTPTGRVVADTTGRFMEAPGHREGVAEWVGDARHVLDLLLAPRLTSHLAALAGAVDAERIGAVGHSTGGLVALATCEADSRVRACINMDGGLADPGGEPLADFVPSGITSRVLFLRSQPLYDDTTLARRGMTREEWDQRGAGPARDFQALVERSSGRIAVARVAGTGHMSFSDAPFVMPTTITRFGGRIIEPRRGFAVISAALRAFLDRELRWRGDSWVPLLDRMPELTVAEGG